MFKDELRETVMKNQLGDFMHNESYLVSTLCDPRYIGLKVHRIWFSPTSLRHKDSFYLDEQTGQRARDLLVCLVEEQMEAGGANNNEQDVVQGEAWEEEEGSSSILHNMCKRIRRSRERHMEVVILMQLRCSLNYSAILLVPQDTGSSPASTVEVYLRLPLEEVKCLRFWQKFEEETPPNDYVRKALLCVARRHLTPPPSYTNVKRLFNYGGLVATDHRSSLFGEKLDQILFLRDNALMANFDLG